MADQEAMLDEVMDNLREAAQRIRATRYLYLRQIEARVLPRGFGIP